jgi:prolyl oligopeptidase
VRTKLDQANPVLLNGYGGFSISLTPRFLGADRRLWLDGNGIYVVANLRAVANTARSGIGWAR